MENETANKMTDKEKKTLMKPLSDVMSRFCEDWNNCHPDEWPALAANHIEALRIELSYWEHGIIKIEDKVGCK